MYMYQATTLQDQVMCNDFSTESHALEERGQQKQTTSCSKLPHIISCCKQTTLTVYS